MPDQRTPRRKNFFTAFKPLVADRGGHAAGNAGAGCFRGDLITGYEFGILDQWPQK